MNQMPISLITIFHPEKILGMTYSNLKQLPQLKKDRLEQEKNKKLIATKNDIDIIEKLFHQRIIGNFGNPKVEYRKTYIDGINVKDLINDYSIRLIYTIEQGGQAAYKLEVRPNWGDEPNKLSNEIIGSVNKYFLENKLSIRQLWLNPFTRNLKQIPDNSFYKIGLTANLILGPYDKYEVRRESKIHFKKIDKKVKLHQHTPFYHETLNDDEIILENISLWFIEY